MSKYFGGFLLTLILTTSVWAASWKTRSASEFNLQVPERVGTFQHPVIFVSDIVRTHESSSSAFIIRQELIVQWGLHVFELGDAVYECHKRGRKMDCEYVDFVRVATYESCSVIGRRRLCSLALTDDQVSARDADDPAIHDTFDIEPERGSSSNDYPERVIEPELPLP